MKDVTLRGPDYSVSRRHDVTIVDYSAMHRMNVRCISWRCVGISLKLTSSALLLLRLCDTE